MSFNVATAPEQPERRCERCRHRPRLGEIEGQEPSEGARVICFHCFQASRTDPGAEPPADAPRPQPSPSPPGGRVLSAVDVAHRRRMLAHLHATPGRHR
jgi:hypothetical protein